MCTGAARLCEACLESLGPSRNAGGGLGRERLTARVPATPRTEEEAHLDRMLSAEFAHLVELGVRQHHHTRPLGDPVDHDAHTLGLFQHRSKDPWTLNARNLDMPARAVGKPKPGLGPRPARCLKVDLFQPGSDLGQTHRWLLSLEISCPLRGRQ